MTHIHGNYPFKCSDVLSRCRAFSLYNGHTVLCTWFLSWKIFSVANDTGRISWCVYHQNITGYCCDKIRTSQCITELRVWTIWHYVVQLKPIKPCLSKIGDVAIDIVCVIVEFSRIWFKYSTFCCTGKLLWFYRIWKYNSLQRCFGFNDLWQLCNLGPCNNIKILMKFTICRNWKPAYMFVIGYKPVGNLQWLFYFYTMASVHVGWIISRCTLFNVLNRDVKQRSTSRNTSNIIQIAPFTKWWYAWLVCFRLLLLSHRFAYSSKWCIFNDIYCNIVT